MKVPSIKNGAKGISVFILILPSAPFNCFFERNITLKLTIDPIQNARIIAERPKYIPSIHPRPSISFASPSPIHLPPETSHRIANGNANNGPAMRYENVGNINNAPKLV